MVNKVIWRHVQDFKGVYIVSSEGNIVALPRVITRKQNGMVVEQPVDGKTIVKLTGNYPSVHLCKNGMCTFKYVHEIVAETFIGPRPSPKHHICHNDGNPLNANVSNLRYDTPKGNASDRRKHGTDAVGENNPMAKNSEQKIRNVKEALKTKPQYLVATEFDMPKSTVRSIKQGRTWGHVK